LPEVSIEYFKTKGEKPVDLLLNPHRQSSPGKLRRQLKARLEEEKRLSSNSSYGRYRPSEFDPGKIQPLVYNETHVVAHLWFEELIRCALPMTKWWAKYVWRTRRPEKINLQLLPQLKEDRETKDPAHRAFSEDLYWLLRFVGRYAWEFIPGYAPADHAPGEEDLITSALKFMDGMVVGGISDEFMLWSVSNNRPAKPALRVSAATVKADAVRNLFKTSCKNLCWAIVDSGVDARHPAFIDREKAGAGSLQKQHIPADLSRVRRTYDFTKMRNLLDPDAGRNEDQGECVVLTPEMRRQMKDIKAGLRSGKLIDWDALEPLLRVPHDEKYEMPAMEHGTHVAGILASDWRAKDGNPPPGEKEDLLGMCPDIQLYDLRVLDKDGIGSEFTVLAALQFIRHLNAHKDLPIIHGVNLSLSLDHEVTSYACGRTPVCDECERLIGNGVVVVAAAGNKGYTGKFAASLGVADFQDISITDPGNAEGVITVGATHRGMPHTYGVSYFSSRGPTGDGRSKPDLVAPGEKIKSTIPEAQMKSMDGTSMAAPHVSGAAALLMARHSELIGQPSRIKLVLCRTATDLGRERYFQGAGLVDVLRAIQSL